MPAPKSILLFITVLGIVLNLAIVLYARKKGKILGFYGGLPFVIDRDKNPISFAVCFWVTTIACVGFFGVFVYVFFWH